MADPICSCHTPIRFWLAKRPVAFALEVLAALALSTAGAWLAAKAGHKMNAKANGDIRAAAAQERMASALEAIAAASTYNRYDAHPKPEQRRRITANEDAFITAHQACWTDAYVGYDNEIHPDYCRP